MHRHRHDVANLGAREQRALAFQTLSGAVNIMPAARRGRPGLSIEAAGRQAPTGADLRPRRTCPHIVTCPRLLFHQQAHWVFNIVNRQSLLAYVVARCHS